MQSSPNDNPENDVIMKLFAMLPQAAPSTKPIRCADCGTKNNGKRKFCGKCGKHLWEPCLRCSEPNPAHEEFCGNCGVHLPTVLQQTAVTFESHLETAGDLYKNFRFQEAIHLLKPVAAAVHSRLAPAADRAKSLLHQSVQAQTGWLTKGHQLEETIPGLVADGNIELALKQIREIPHALRSPALCKTLEDLENRRAEIMEIQRSLALQGKQPLTSELMEKVTRLLTLQPNHPEATKLSLALKRAAMRKAIACVQAGEHEKAWEVINRVPESFRDEDFLTLREQIGNLAYLAWDISHAPFADKTLVTFACRLQKRLPEDSHLNTLCRKLESREISLKNSPLANYSNIEPSPTSIFNVPLEFLRDLGPVRIDQCANAEVFAENPGRFAVAAGLALQGLAASRLKVNLMPEENWRGKLCRMLVKRDASAAWGIEISASGIKAVKLVLESNEIRKTSPVGQPLVSLTDCRIIEHRRRLMQSTNDKERDTLLEETLQTFIEQNPIKNEHVVLGLPDWMVLIKTVELPPMPLDKREAAIHHEARHLFPSPLGDVLWKHERFDDPKEEQSLRRPFTVAYFGVRHMLLKELLARWHKAGMKVATVQCDMAALYNFAMFQETAEKQEETSVFIDLGANRLNVLACCSKHFWHRSVMFGSDQINKALIREFKLTYSQAEEWKRDPTQFPSIGKYYETLQPIYEIYVEEILASLAAYRKEYPGVSIRRIVGCGGGFAAHDLPRYLLYRR